MAVDIDVGLLRELAEEATPGSWDLEVLEDTIGVNAGTARTEWVEHEGGVRTGVPASSYSVAHKIIEYDVFDEDETTPTYRELLANARFIAATGPEVVLELLKMLEQTQQPEQVTEQQPVPPWSGW